MQPQQPIPVQGLQQPVVFYPGVVNRNNNNGRVENYRWKQSKVLGVLQILIGIICIICNAVSIGLFNYYRSGSGVINVVGYGIWNGLLFIAAGVLGMVAAGKQTKCSIISFMVMCIISASFTSIVFSLAIIGAIFAASRNPSGYAGCDDGYYYSYMSSYNYYLYGRPTSPPCPQKDAAIAMESLMVCMAFIEAIIAIWGSVICCKAICCCAPSGCTQVMFIPQYCCSTQPAMPVDSQQAPFQQVPYYVWPTPTDQNPQYLANVNHIVPANLNPNIQMTWNPPPYLPNVQAPSYEQPQETKRGSIC